MNLIKSHCKDDMFLFKKKKKKRQNKVCSTKYKATLTFCKIVSKKSYKSAIRMISAGMNHVTLKTNENSALHHRSKLEFSIY